MYVIPNQRSQCTLSYWSSWEFLPSNSLCLIQQFQQLTIETWFCGFHLIRIFQNTKEHRLGNTTLSRDSSSHPLSVQSLIHSLSTVTNECSFILQFASMRKLQKACGHVFYNTGLVTEESMYSRPHKSLGTGPPALDEKREELEEEEGVSFSSSLVMCV